MENTFQVLNPSKKKGHIVLWYLCMQEFHQVSRHLWKFLSSIPSQKFDEKKDLKNLQKWRHTIGESADKGDHHQKIIKEADQQIINSQATQLF